MKILEQRLTSPFGERIHPITEKLHFHTGIDLVNDENKNVYASLQGIVRR